MPKIRLQKHIADLGICSRRKAEVLISEGKVMVNGTLVTKLGTKVDPESDKVEVQDAQPTTRGSSFIYIALHKPIDYITSTTSTQGRSVMDLLTKAHGTGKARRNVTERVYPVGRLDKDSEGLVLLTNDGELANQMTHPSFEHTKIYDVIIDKALSKDAKQVLELGMNIGDKKRVRGITIVKETKKGRQHVVTVELTEGKNRQIRKMFGRLGYTVHSLRRTQLGNLKLGTLPSGKWRFVQKKFII